MESNIVWSISGPDLTVRNGESFVVEENGWKVARPPELCEFVVLGKPQPAGSKKAMMPKKARYPIVVDDNKHAKAYKQSVAGVALAAMNGRSLFAGPVEVRMLFVLERPKSHYRAGGELSAAGERAPMHVTRPDVLKLARAVEDGMTGVVYKDDGQIVRETLSKVWGSEPRALIAVTEVTT